MCGIVGYVGKESAVEFLLEGLQRLEYRGYDSAGVAILNGQGLSVHKSQGKLNALMASLEEKDLHGTLGIGHTRWATHGLPSKTNAHPHVDSKSEIAVVHNGIIENFRELRQALESKGHQFQSETDTEVIPHLIESLYKGDLRKAVEQALKKIQGSYALAVISEREPTRLVAARKGSPLIVGVGNKEYYVASDVPAVLKKTKKVIYLKDGDVVDLYEGEDPTSYKNGSVVTRPIETVDLDISAAEKEGHPHFMIKEILEQPRSLKQTMASRIQVERVYFEELEAIDEFLVKRMNRVIILGCGTAYHAGLVGGYLMEKLIKVPVDVDMSSEFRYSSPLITPETLVIAITQSGETADTLASVRLTE